jgi:hypothetical protein
MNNHPVILKQLIQTGAILKSRITEIIWIAEYWRILENLAR